MAVKVDGEVVVVVEVVVVEQEVLDVADGAGRSFRRLSLCSKGIAGGSPSSFLAAGMDEGVVECVRLMATLPAPS